jgi:hypothetical protein
MLFNSYPFVFVFLPITLAGFFALGRRSRGLAIAWLALNLFLLLRLVVQVVHLKKHSEHCDLHPAWSNGILRSIFEAEIPILRRMDLPVGASIVCVARKVT